MKNLLLLHCCSASNVEALLWTLENVCYLHFHTFCAEQVINYLKIS